MFLRKLFPRYVDGPEFRPILLSVLYLLVREFLLSGLLVFLGGFSLNDGTLLSYIALWIQLILDFVVMLLIYWSYLSESLVSFRLYRKTCVKPAAIGAGVALALSVAVLFLTGRLVPAGDLFLRFPTDFFCLFSIPSMLAAVFLMPLALCCMLHVTFFGKLCGERPWLAYPLVTIVLLALHLFSDPMFSSFPQVFVSMLPAHLCAGWAYQKSNNICSGILLLTFFNLAMVIVYLLFPEVVVTPLLNTAPS